jgi:hypothetical protein
VSELGLELGELVEGRADLGQHLGFGHVLGDLRVDRRDVQSASPLLRRPARARSMTTVRIARAA